MEEAYRRLCEAQESPETWNDAGKLKALVSGFQEFIPCEDCQSRIHECQWRIYALEDEKKKRKARKRKKNTIISAALLAAALVIALIVKLMITSLVVLPDQYRQAEALLEAGDKVNAAISFGKCGDYRDARERSFALWDEIAVRKTICADYYYTIAVKNDGTVAYAGEEGKRRTLIENWTDIIAIDIDRDRIVGLKRDGTVLVYKDGICIKNYYGWTDIVAIDTSGPILALKDDGTVLSDGAVYFNTRTWESVAPSLGNYGLTRDGTIYDGEAKKPKWADIVCKDGNAVLKHDGTVIIYGEDMDWTDIIAVASGEWHTVGLKSDGTVVARLEQPEDEKNRNHGQCAVSDWTDIVAVSAGARHTVGLKSDGTVVATEITRQIQYEVDWKYSWIANYDCGQCDVSDWTDIKLPTGPLVVQ